MNTLERLQSELQLWEQRKAATEDSYAISVCNRRIAQLQRRIADMTTP